MRVYWLLVFGFLGGYGLGVAMYLQSEGWWLFGIALGILAIWGIIASMTALYNKGVKEGQAKR